MYQLNFDARLCRTCPTGDCLAKCQYLHVKREKAREEMVRISEGKDSFVLRDCVTCYACEEYCRRGNHPFYLITERRQEKAIPVAPRAVSRQWINIGEPQGKFRAGRPQERVLSLGFMPEYLSSVRGKLFEDLLPSRVFGQEFFCNVVYLHFADTAIIQERLPRVIDRFRNQNAREVVFLHDECYGAFSSLAPAYGMEVPFKPIHYFEHLVEQLHRLRQDIRPLRLRAAYQRPCSARLCPDQHPRVREIMDLIGVDLVDREYQDENAICCGGIFSLCFGYDLAHDVQERNLADMAKHGAEVCVFNCPACQNTLGARVAKRSIRPVHMIDLCRMAIGEIPPMEG
jgi:Fe-S oxidoreductase